ncbi:hypothetical protein BRD17_09400 [Halobacteriales archaeon SW_7_68_16]|nr:MAG: hypothetical protein BRD17_09400 [Halobacteriales archaeon SW_7_68_16]
MIVRFGDRREGRVVTLSERRSDRVAAAVRDPDDDRVSCPPPGPAHEFVGLLRGKVTVPVRAGLAAVARSRGRRSSVRDEIDRLDGEIAAIDAESVDLRERREQVAAARDRAAGLDEHVARLQGTVTAIEEDGRDASAARAELHDAARALSEAETERHAAEQRLDRARKRARESRDRRERRLELRDEVGNLRRTARRELAATVADAVECALGSVPGRDSGVDGWQDGRTGGIDLALALARVADLNAPVVVAVDRFDDPEDAAAWLDAPVLRVQ